MSIHIVDVPCSWSVEFAGDMLLEFDHLGDARKIRAYLETIGFA